MIGASLAGCLAVGCLADVTGEVLLVERDRLPTAPRPRPGIPQGRFPHLLLPAGVRGLDALLPGIIQELTAAGAAPVSIPRQVHVLTPFGWFPSFSSSSSSSELGALACSRSLLDHHVRARVLRDRRVTVLDHTAATGLGIAGGRVRSVFARERGTTTSTEIPAAVVVDAGGRRSLTPEWLGQAGYTGRPPQQIDAGVSYAVRAYPPTPGHEHAKHVVHLQAAPPDELTFSILVPAEDGTRQAGIGTVRPCAAPRTDDEFTRALSRLRDPAVGDALPPGGAPAGSVRTFHPGPSRWNRFDRWRDWPDGLIVLGDALCTLNPVYGQGMSVAVQQALALRHALRTPKPRSNVYRRIRRDLARAVRPAWTISGTEDWRFPHTTGHTSPFSALTHRFLDHLLSTAMTDPALARHLAEVFALTRPPTSLASPTVLRAVAARRVRGPARG
ncbi:NAD(P)/FAD-dependent oxidoreductase [Streptomyces daliensis]